MPDQGVPVELGLTATGEVTHTFHVVQQRHARLLKTLFGKAGVFRSMDEFTELAQSVAPATAEGEDGEDAEKRDVTDSDVAAEVFDNLIHAAEGKLYDVFCIFIPDLMPRWEFEGYGSEGHLDRDEYVEELDRSPSVPQMVTAFETAVQVNGLRWVNKLSGFFDSKMLKAEVNLAISRMFREVQAQQTAIQAKAGEAREIPTSGSASPSSPPANGASAQTSSGMTDQTPSEPAESEAAVSASPSPDS